MATVYEGEVLGAEGFRKPVVVKRIHPHLTRHGAFVEMLVREAKLTVRLDHPNVVDVLELGQAGDDYFLVMERVDGCDLAQLISSADRDGVRLPAELAAHVVREVLAGLGHAHEATDDQGRSLGIVHRDVSPSNVLLGLDGRVKLTDFGVARSEADETHGGLKGKPAYMSPEQALGAALDARSDLYAAGLLLYEMLAGRRALEGGAEIELLNAARAGALARAPFAAVPTRYHDVLRRSLDPDPRQRHASAAQMRRALAPLAMDMETGRERLAELLSLLQPKSVASLASGDLQTASDPGQPGRVLVTRSRTRESSAPGTTASVTAKAPLPRWTVGVVGALAVAAILVFAGRGMRTGDGSATVAPEDAADVETSDPPEVVSENTGISRSVAIPDPADVSGGPVDRDAGAVLGAAPTPDVRIDEPADPSPPEVVQTDEHLPPADGVGTLSVVVPGANAEVTVDVPGWELRNAPFQRAELPAGTWPVSVDNPDLGLHWEGQVSVAPGADVGLQLRRTEDGWEPWVRRPE